jgi:hypothetical protein
MHMIWRSKIMDNKKMENTNIPQEKENKDLEFNIEEVEPIIAPFADDGFAEDDGADSWSCSRKRWCC